MLKYVSKFAMDILPSVAATIIGAYIVNHYIVTKPGADAPLAAAVSAADPKVDGGKPVAIKSADVAGIPAAGIKAKGISEKAILEKTASEKPSSAEKPQEKLVEGKPAETKPAEARSLDTPTETASIPPDTRRHPPAPRDKAIAKVVPAPVQPAVAPVVVTPSPAPAVEASVAPDEHRDVNDLARAAIDRLRGSNEGPPRAADASRGAETPRVSDTPRIVTAPVVRPLPPPIMVSTPTAESLDQGSPLKPPYAATARADDPRRPTPPADIPTARPPLDLRAEASEPAIREHATSVADDMLSAAKLVFHAVLPK